MSGGTLRYKLECRRFNFRWCLWNFSLTYSFRPHCYPGIGSVSKINEYQVYFLYGADNITTFLWSLSSNMGTSTSGNTQGLYKDCFTSLLQDSYQRWYEIHSGENICLPVLHETVLSTPSTNKIFKISYSSLNKDGVIDQHHLL